MATRISEGNAEGLIFYSIDQGKVLWSGCFQVVTFSYRTSVMALCKRKTQYKCYGIYSTLFNIYTGGGGGRENVVQYYLSIIINFHIYDKYIILIIIKCKDNNNKITNNKLQ